MSHEKELLKRGAECVTGDLILRGQVVGRYRNGEFAPTPEGLAELEISEVEAKPVAEPAKPRGRKKADAAVLADDPSDTLADVDGLIEG